MTKILNICLAVFIGAAVIYLIAEEYQENDERGKIVVSFMSTGSREQKESYQQVIREFEKENPGIKIRLQWGATGRFFGVVLTRMAGGVAPDVVFMYESMMPHFADKNTLEDLTPYIKRDLSDYDEDFHPLSRKIFAYNGKTYAMPVTMAPILVIYNKGMFDEAGVPYPDEGWTWDEFLEIAKKLTKKDKNGRTVQYGFGHALSFHLIEKMSSQRGLIDGSPVKANYAHPEMVEAVRFATELITKHGVAPNTAAREVAEIDGATAWDKFWKITWPMVSPTTFFISIMSVIAGFQGGFMQAFTMTRGGPAGATTTLGYYIYNTAYQDFNMGYACTIALVLFTVVLCITMLNWKFGGKRVNY